MASWREVCAELPRLMHRPLVHRVIEDPEQLTSSSPFAAPDAVARCAGLPNHVDRVGGALARLRPLPTVRVQIPAVVDMRYSSAHAPTCHPLSLSDTAAAG